MNKKRKKRHRSRKYLIDLVIPKVQYRLLLKVAEALGLSLEDLIIRSLQEYYTCYLIPVVMNTTQIKQ